MYLYPYGSVDSLSVVVIIVFIVCFCLSWVVTCRRVVFCVLFCSLWCVSPGAALSSPSPRREWISTPVLNLLIRDGQLRGLERRPVASGSVGSLQAVCVFGCETSLLVYQDWYTLLSSRRSVFWSAVF